MSKAWPETLLDNSVYSHPVDDVRLIETHISWVVLTGQFAYKIKKPVNLGFLDFTTLALRRHYCERELELNRRFCRDLYLDVVPVTGTWQQPRIDGNGRIFDYAVKMRQFDNRQLADNLARNGQLNDELVRGMAKTLARIHAELPSISETSEYGFAKDFYAAAMENFSQIRAYSLSREIQQSLAALEQWTGTVYQRNRPLLEQRRREGHVKDCHGDCHLGNIVILDGKITLFDCIEFNDSFRIQDTISEAAFLSMDLCARNLPEQSRRFVNIYLEYCGDYDALSLFNLFRCYYALVRAKVYLLRQPAPNQPAITAETHSEFYRYVTLAERFTEKNTGMLVLMHGLSGSGKSHVAEKVAAKFNAIRIRSDVERKRLFHLAPEQPGTNEPNLYSAEASRRTFDRLLALSQSIVVAGFGCIVDATFLSRAAREPFIHWATREKNIPLVILHCDASEPVILQRLQQRTVQGGDASDADCAVYRQQLSVAEPLSPDESVYLVSVDTEHADCIDFAVAQLTRLIHDNQSTT
jgi:aminoglycoside phosphotransferase family enzyme/predicted kinase